MIFAAHSGAENTPRTRQSHSNWKSCFIPLSGGTPQDLQAHLPWRQTSELPGVQDTCPCGSWLHKDTWLAGQERSVTSAGPPRPPPWPPATGLSQAVPLPCSGEALDVHPDLPQASKPPQPNLCHLQSGQCSQPQDAQGP